MAVTEESVRETEVAQKGGAQVVRRTTSTASSAETQLTVINGVWLILGILEVILGLRFVLKLLGANAASSFVNLVYSVSRIFVSPFNGIFTTPTLKGNVSVSVFETATLIAIVIYALIVWGIVKLLSLNRTT